MKFELSQIAQIKQDFDETHELIDNAWRVYRQLF
jgi:hypothetical protein